MTNASPKTMIRNAYGILSFQLAGEPRWLDTDMYDIVATTGSTEKISSEQLKLLLQNLLAERFRLKVHWETRKTSVYALVLDKNGPKFKESAEVQEPGINTPKGPGRAQMKGTREPISILASNLGNLHDRYLSRDRRSYPGPPDGESSFVSSANGSKLFNPADGSTAKRDQTFICCIRPPRGRPFTED